MGALADSGAECAPRHGARSRSASGTRTVESRGAGDAHRLATAPARPLSPRRIGGAVSALGRADTDARRSRATPSCGTAWRDLAHHASRRRAGDGLSYRRVLGGSLAIRRWEGIGELRGD